MGEITKKERPIDRFSGRNNGKGIEKNEKDDELRGRYNEREREKENEKK